MTEERTAAGPVSIVRRGVTPRSAGAAFVPKRSILDTLGNGVGEIERDTAALAARAGLDVHMQIERAAA